nr:MAG TPA: hypothetical protein [Caudoviricetes sp.]
MNVGLCKVSDFRGCARGVVAAFLLLLSILTMGVKTCAGRCGLEVGGVRRKSPRFRWKTGGCG